MSSLLFAVVALCVLSVAFGFSLNTPKFSPQVAVSKTQVFEDFNLDFKNPKIYSSKEIFSEKQLRAYTATYSVDNRINPLDFIFGLFKKGEETPATPAAPTPSYANALKATISVKLLEEKTVSYLQGKTDVKTYAGILKSAFGEKLPSVLSQILANLPEPKAAELSKILK